VVPGLPSGAVEPLFRIAATSVLLPSLPLGLSLLLAEAFIGLEMSLIFLIEVYMVENGLCMVSRLSVTQGRCY